MKTRIGAVCRFFFGDSVRSFGTMSLVFLISLAIAPSRDFLSEWHGYQRGYIKMVRARGDAVTLERRFQPGLQQIWIPEQGVVDRCQTCHLGLKETALKDSPQPFRPHPQIPHTLTAFGCVSCHRGQGPATTVEEAHHSTLAWEQPLLPAAYLQSGCGECHLAPLAGAPQLREGRRLLAAEGCVRCHTAKLGDESAIVATDDPPSLQHIADKTSREWLYAWIRDPQAYSSTATMPNFGFTADDARDISAYLVAQSTPLQRDQHPPSAAAAEPAAGTSLYGEMFCASCHATQNAAGNLVGGDLGPELTKVGSKVKPEWLAAWLRDPQHYDPDTRMPHYRFSEQQIGTLVGYLQGKSDSDLLAAVHLDPATPQQITHGRALVVEYGCASCHQINGIKKPDNFAPELSRVGSRSLSQLAFAPGVPHTLPDYIAAKVRNPRAFGAGLKMPHYALSERQIDSLTTALLAMTDRSHRQPLMLRIATRPASDYRPAGTAGKLMDDLRCFTCHRINGRGGDMAPDLSWEGSVVKRDWLIAFFKNPNTLRPALIRRMPKFNLGDAEAQTLTDYILNVYQSPNFSRDDLQESFLASNIERGKELFYSKYACQSCHIADFAKDKGYIGPQLSQSGSRLSAAWIYHWLKDPQSLRPGTIEPNQHMSDADAMSLTAFLSSLKGKPAAGAKR